MFSRATALGALLWVRLAVPLLVSVSTLALLRVDAFHDCVQSRKRARNRGRRVWRRLEQHAPTNTTIQASSSSFSSFSSFSCGGGICVGMTNGPHQGGNASYPVAWNGTTGTYLKSFVTVPEYPSGPTTKDDFSEITYYIWTDVFFGDESFGRMNQLVPQLILGSALDGSSGPPDFHPEWNKIHDTWAFGAHYFFEVWNPVTNTTDAHAAYGKLFPALPGETLETTFELLSPGIHSSSAHDPPVSPAWTLTMSVVGDPSRTSVLTIFEPYMGLGRHWKPKQSTSWLEPNFRNMCINACWELYGATDAGKLPASGARYKLEIEQPASLSGRSGLHVESVRSGTDASAAVSNRSSSEKTSVSLRERLLLRDDDDDDDDGTSNYYDFTTWERDEGNGVCPSCTVTEVHNERKQEVFVEIDVGGNNNNNNN